MGCQLRDYTLQTVDVAGMLVRVYQDPAARPGIDAWNAIHEALKLIPREHLALLGDYGYIQLSKPGCPPFRGGGHNPEVPYARLSHACLSSSYNRHCNITLLHEYGHIVDAHYEAMAWLRTNAPEDFRLLSSTGHQGATGGPGERFADCYMLYLMNVVAGVRTGHPADRAAYQGEQATRRYNILRSTPAFTAIGEPTQVTSAASAVSPH